MTETCSGDPYDPFEGPYDPFEGPSSQEPADNTTLFIESLRGIGRIVDSFKVLYL